MATLELEIAPEAHRQPARGAGKAAERNARLIALLDAFEAGDAEQQRQELAALQAGIDEARPDQRSIFDEGVNP